jgi:hypothetical protein
MAVITNSNQTLAIGTPGNWWTPTTTTITVDVDNAAMVTLETRRGSGDSAQKPVFLGDQKTTIFRGPCSLMLQVVVGRDYRFNAVNGAAAVAAFD